MLHARARGFCKKWLKATGLGVMLQRTHPVVNLCQMDSYNQIVPNSSDNSVIVIPQFEYEFIQK